MVVCGFFEVPFTRNVPSEKRRPYSPSFYALLGLRDPVTTVGAFFPFSLIHYHARDERKRPRDALPKVGYGRMGGEPFQGSSSAPGFLFSEPLTATVARSALLGQGGLMQCVVLFFANVLPSSALVINSKTLQLWHGSIESSTM